MTQNGSESYTQPMAAWSFTARSGGRCDVGYSLERGGYWIVFYIAGTGFEDFRLDGLATVVELIAATEGEVDWDRQRRLVRDLVNAGPRSHMMALNHLVGAARADA